ncbi:hypothetical protein EXIGLDRAFT_694209, partial [Exidia glandulosa HHB12029]
MKQAPANRKARLRDLGDCGRRGDEVELESESVGYVDLSARELGTPKHDVDSSATVCSSSSRWVDSARRDSSILRTTSSQQDLTDIDLTTRNAAWAWTQAFRNVELPDRPPNLSGHYYAALLFEAICDICYGRCKMLKDTYWDFSKRVCIKCSRTHFVAVPDTIHGLSNAQIVQVVPASRNPGGVASHGNTLDSALRKVEQEIGGVVDDPTKLAVYIQKTTLRLSAVEAHAREVGEWNEKEVVARQKSDRGRRRGTSNR